MPQLAAAVRRAYHPALMAKTFRCKLVTPSSALLDGQVSYANVPVWDGLMGIQPGRAPILARLGLGELRP